jgi:hypothetical protein
MSGLEVIAAVTAIIEVFNSSATLFREWSQKRRERREHRENRKLEQSLIVGSSSVRNEYDPDFARLGRKFAVGEGNTYFQIFGSILQGLDFPDFDRTRES